MNSPVLNLSWQDVENACIDVSHQIAASKFKADIILPVLWGGIIPARMILDIMNIPRDKMKPIYAKSYEGCKASTTIDVEMKFPNNDYKEHRVLIIEEIVDSGRTVSCLKNFLESYSFKKEHVRVATLVWRKSVSLMCGVNYYHKEVNKEWVIFPWDKQEYMRANCL